MPDYVARYPVGTRVKVADLARLQNFRLRWQFHHKLIDVQLNHASATATVARVNYYHGGDVLYELEGVPGIWHEECLERSSETVK